MSRCPHIARPVAVFIVLMTIGTVTVAAPAMAQSAGAFSRIGFGARGIALGNALAADVDGPASPYYNPALAPRATRQHLSAAVAALSFDRSLQYLQLVAPLRQNAGVAVGLIHAAVSGIDGRDNAGFHTRELSIDEYAGFLAFGIKPSSKMSLGIGVQFFRTDLYEGMSPGVSIGIDLGMTVQLTEGVFAAFVVDDLLARYQWNSEPVNGASGKKTTDNFPVRLRFGMMTSRLVENLFAMFEIEARFTRVEAVRRSVSVLGGEPVERTDQENLTLSESRLRFGAEYRLLSQFALRAGLEQLGSEVLGGVRPSAGFMIEESVGTMVVRFDYAFSLESPASGTMHLFSLRLYL